MTVYSVDAFFIYIKERISLQTLTKSIFKAFDGHKCMTKFILEKKRQNFHLFVKDS